MTAKQFLIELKYAKKSNLTDLCMLAYLIHFLKDDRLYDIDTLTEEGLLQIKNKICRSSVLSDDF